MTSNKPEVLLGTRTEIEPQGLGHGELRVLGVESEACRITPTKGCHPDFYLLPRVGGPPEPHKGSEHWHL